MDARPGNNINENVCFEVVHRVPSFIKATRSGGAGGASLFDSAVPIADHASTQAMNVF